MPEESVDEFLEKAAAGRQPLSEQEKKKAMVESWKLRDIAKGRTAEWETSVTLKKEEKSTRLTIFVDRLKPEDKKPSWAPKDSDVSIRVVRDVRNARGTMIPGSFESYYLSSSAVVKETAIFPERSAHSEAAAFIEESLYHEIAVREEASLSKGQITEEVYIPDKSDLQNLSHLVSSAQKVVIPSVVRS